MTEQLHPMVPPNILLNNWESDWFNERENVDVLLIQAYQAGADCQLEADAEWLDQYSLDASHLTIIPTGKGLVEAMRPKPPSLKEQALMALEDGDTGPGALLTATEVCIIRRALEQIDD